MAGLILTSVIFHKFAYLLVTLVMLRPVIYELKSTWTPRELLHERNTGIADDFLPSRTWQASHTWRPASRKKYFGAKLIYYPNSESSFQLMNIEMSGDVAKNPGPGADRKDCAGCSKALRRNQNGVKCLDCAKTFHIKCSGLNRRELSSYRIHGSWYCSCCSLPQFSDSFFNDSTHSESNLEFSLNEQDSQEKDRDFASFSDARLKYSSDFLIAHLNINSYQNKFDEMKEIIQKLRIQVMIISETKIDGSYPDAQFAIPGYTPPYRSDRKKGGGGILAYLSSNVICKRLKVPRCYKTIESVVLEIKLKDRQVIVAGLYRFPKPLASTYQQQLVEEMNHFCNWVSLQGHAFVLLGDLNLDRLRPDKPEGKLLIDIEETHGLECLITQPKRIQSRAGRTTKTLIDVILTNEAHLFIKSGIYDPGLSDHPIVYGFMQHKAAKAKPRIIKFRTTKNFEEEKFQEHLNSAPWHVGEVFDCVEDQVCFTSTLLTDIVNEHMPFKQMRVRDQDVPHMTLEWKEAIRARRRVARLYRKTNATDDWVKLKKLRNEATRLRRKAIKSYWKAKAENLKIKPQDFYKTFTPFLSSKSKCNQVSDIKLNINGQVSSNKEEISDAFGEYFATIADGIGHVNKKMCSLDDFDNHSSVMAIRAANHNNSQHFSFRSIRPCEVTDTLKQLKPGKAMGWDLLPPKALKAGACELTKPLTGLFNACIEQGY